MSRVQVVYLGVAEEIETPANTTATQLIDVARGRFSITRDGWQLVTDDGAVVADGEPPGGRGRDREERAGVSDELTAWEAGIMGALAQQLTQGAVEPSMVALLRLPALRRVRQVVLVLAAYLLLGEERSGQG